MPTATRHPENYLQEPYDLFAYLSSCSSPRLEPTTRRSASPSRRGGPALADPWLAAWLRPWAPFTLARLHQALIRAGYPDGTLEQDLARPLLALGELPFFRLDIYRHWLLAQGGPDLLAELRQHSAHLDEPR